MREVDFDTFFTSSKRITLDSVYFQAGSRVQCAARAVNSNGDEGLELSSVVVAISVEEGGCKSHRNLLRAHTHTHTKFILSGNYTVTRLAWVFLILYCLFKEQAKLNTPIT